jgi:hypothetical protein
VRLLAGKTVARETAPNVAVRVRRCVVAIHVPKPGIRAIAPVAADVGAIEISDFPFLLFAALVPQPAAKNGAEIVDVLCPVSILTA